MKSKLLREVRQWQVAEEHLPAWLPPRRRLLAGLADLLLAGAAGPSGLLLRWLLRWLLCVVLLLHWRL